MQIQDSHTEQVLCIFIDILNLSQQHKGESMVSFCFDLFPGQKSNTMQQVWFLVWKLRIGPCSLHCNNPVQKSKLQITVARTKSKTSKQIKAKKRCLFIHRRFWRCSVGNVLRILYDGFNVLALSPSRHRFCKEKAYRCLNKYFICRYCHSLLNAIGPKSSIEYFQKTCFKSFQLAALLRATHENKRKDPWEVCVIGEIFPW